MTHLVLCSSLGETSMQLQSHWLWVCQSCLYLLGILLENHVCSETYSFYLIFPGLRYIYISSSWSAFLWSLLKQCIFIINFINSSLLFLLLVCTGWVINFVYSFEKPVVCLIDSIKYSTSLHFSNFCPSVCYFLLSTKFGFIWVIFLWTHIVE